VQRSDADADARRFTACAHAPAARATDGRFKISGPVYTGEVWAMGRTVVLETESFTAVVTSVFAGLIPLAAIAALANAGTLAAFVAVCAAMLTLRVREPDRERACDRQDPCPGNTARPHTH